MGIRQRRLTRLAVAAVVLVGVGAAGVWYYRAARPEARLRRGYEAFERGDDGEALRMADEMEDAGAADQARVLRGRVYVRRGQWDRAVREYAAISPGNEEARAEASLAYGLALLPLGRHAEAEKFLLHAAQTRPGAADAHRGLARIYYDRGAMMHALDRLERWAGLAPRDGEPYRWIGLVHDALASYPSAADHYREALARELSPRLRREVTLELAEVLVKQSAYDEALTVLDGLVAGVESPAAEVRAECLNGLGRHAEAVALLERVLAARPTSARALRCRALIHVAAGEAAAALPLLEQVLRADPYDFLSRYPLAQALEALNRGAEAADQRRRADQSRDLLAELSRLNKEASARPTDAAVRRRLAGVADQLGKRDMAEMWRRAAALCPAEPAGP